MGNKICFINTVGRAYDYFLKEQIELLNNSGFDVDFVCSDTTEIKSEFIDRVNYLEIPMKRGVSILDVFKCTILFYKLFKGKDFDMVVYSGPNASFYASIAAMFARIPIRIYSQWGIRYVGFNGVRRFVFKSIERVICGVSTVIQPDSKSNLRFAISENLYSESKAYVIGEGSAKGVDFNRFNIDHKNKWRDEIRKKYNIDDEDIVIGFVGALRKEKGLDELLKAFKEIDYNYNKIKLLLVGDKDLYCTINENLRAWAERNNNIIFCGTTQEVHKYYASMDIFAFPSYREGFGMGAIEAGAMGVPVIASRIPGPIDSVIDNKTGYLVEVKNWEQIKERVEALISDEQLRKDLGRQALEHVSLNYEMNRLMELYLEDKKELLKRYSKSEWNIYGKS